MKKIISTATLILIIFALALPCLAERAEKLNYITDTVGLLTNDEWYELESYAEEIAEKYSCGVYVIIVDDYTDYGYSMESVAVSIYRYYDLGVGNDGNAIVLLLSMYDRDYWLNDFGSYMAYAITDYDHEELKSSFLDSFRNDAWYGGLYGYLLQSEIILEAAENGVPFDTPPLTFGEKLSFSLIPAFVIGLIVAFTVGASLKAQMKSAKKALFADHYVAPGGIDISCREDRYTHTTTSRYRISSNSGGGRSTRTSSGNHSSGGKF